MSPDVAVEKSGWPRVQTSASNSACIHCGLLTVQFSWIFLIESTWIMTLVQWLLYRVPHRRTLGGLVALACIRMCRAHFDDDHAKGRPPHRNVCKTKERASDLSPPVIVSYFCAPSSLKRCDFADLCCERILTNWFSVSLDNFACQKILWFFSGHDNLGMQKITYSEFEINKLSASEKLHLSSMSRTESMAKSIRTLCSSVVTFFCLRISGGFEALSIWGMRYHKNWRTQELGQPTSANI